MTNLHRCAAPGCGTMIPYHLFMCGPHWARVPVDLQRQVYKTWRAVQRIGVTRETWQPYLEARQAAEKAVAT